MKKTIYLIIISIGLLGCKPKSDKSIVKLDPRVIISYLPSESFSAQTLEKLQEIKNNATDAIEIGAVELVMVAQYAAPGSPIGNEELRAKLQKLASAYPNTWIAIQAKFGLVETYINHENLNQRLATLESILGDSGLDQLSKPSDPYLDAFMTGGEGPEIIKSPLDFVRSRLLYEYTSSYDITQAEKIAAQISQPYWKKFADLHLSELKKLPADVIAKRRASFLKTQKN
jgi:hypothetical protein